MVTIPCSGHAPSPDSPVSMSVCSSVADSAHLSNHTFLHGDTYVEYLTVNEYRVAHDVRIVHIIIASWLK